MATTVPITIGGTTINMPGSGESPNWAPAIIALFQLIAQTLAISSSPSDIPPQIYEMTSNANTNVPIPNLTFSTTTVSGAIVFYNSTRSTDSEDASETGTLLLNYDPSKSPTEKWSVSREYDNDGAQITFSMTDTGQVQFSSTALSGSDHTGFIFFRALAVLNNS